MRFERELTTDAEGRYGEIEFVRATSEIRNPDGSVIFRLADIEVPKPWSQVACDILAQKYFRKAGIPAALKPVDEPGVPAWLRRHVADRDALDAP
jgi:ribonucleoside-diphosphate reductase alpha chain